jgi:hypothetical protein
VTNLPVPILASVAPGGFITAAQRNADIVNGLGFALAPPVFSAYASTTQSVANNVPSPITLDTEAVDSYGGHSTVTNASRYVAQVAGYYVAIGSVTFGSSTIGIRTAQIYKNGTAVPGGYFAGSAGAFNASAIGITVVSLLVGDYIEVWANQSSGGALSTVANDSQLIAWFMHT